MSIEGKIRELAGEFAADLDSHHIEGYALAALEAGESAFFRVPLVSHIVDNLWMGGCRDGVRLPDDFDYVISLYPWEKYTLGPTTFRVEFQAYDGQEIPEFGNLVDTAERYVRDGKTLIHCQAGLNRSGLLSTLVLRRQGMSSRQAINMLRASRSQLVLCNQTFENWLLELDGEVRAA